MVLEIPNLKQLTQRFATALNTQDFIDETGAIAHLDANTPSSLENVLAVCMARLNLEQYNWLKAFSLEFMVTTATEAGLLAEHAKMWSCPRIPARAAIGSVLVTSNSPVDLPINTPFVTDGSVQFLVTTAVTISPGSTVSVPVQASSTGIIGNLAPNTVLTPVSPIPAIVSVQVDSAGITGGAPIEPVESWRARIIAKIRYPTGGGTRQDYINWATEAGAAYVNVIAGWVGAGTVGVLVAMSSPLGTGPVATTPDQIKAIQAYIDARRPVRGNVVVVAAQIVKQNLSIQLNPDTLAAQSQISKAMAAYFPSKGIGGKIYIAELNTLISTINGNQNDLLFPVTDIQLDQNTIATLGDIVWSTAL